MAINIKSGSTWAEIRRHLNEESWNKDGDTMRGGLTLAKDPDGDMEAVTKQYMVSKNLFMPGEKTCLKFFKYLSLANGSHLINKNGKQSGGYFYYKYKGVADTSYCGTISSVTTKCPVWTLSDGEVKAKFIINIPQIKLENWNYQYYLIEGTYNASVLKGFCTIKIIVYYEGEENEAFTIWAEDGEINDNSLLFSKKTVVIDNFKVKAGKAPIFKVDMSIVPTSIGGDSNYMYVQGGNSGFDLSMSMDVGVENNILGTSTNEIGVWSDE